MTVTKLSYADPFGDLRSSGEHISSSVRAAREAAERELTQHRMVFEQSSTTPALQAVGERKLSSSAKRRRRRERSKQRAGAQ